MVRDFSVAETRRMRSMRCAPPFKRYYVGLVAFEIEGAFGSRAVVGKYDAVVLGLLGGEKGCACLFGQVLGDKVAVLGDADRVAQGAGQCFVSGTHFIGSGEQVFVAGGRQGQSLLDTVKTGVDEQGKYDVRVDAAVERTQLHAVGGADHRSAAR